MKKIISLTLIFSLAFLSNGCQKSMHTSVKKLTLNLQEGDPPSLNPYIGVDLRSRCLFLALFEPLMRKSVSGELKLAAADDVEIDSTQTVYTFHIRPHLWSNGEEVTSTHFEEGWKYALSPGSHCFRADLFYPIKNAEKIKKGELPIDVLGVESPDPKTLIVRLERPTAYFLDLTATSFFSPLYVAGVDEPECFNGPFVVKERIYDQRLILKKNPYYWDQSSFDLDEIHFTMVRDPMTALAMYEKGELDLVGDPLSPLPFDVVPHLQQAGSLKIKPISRIFYLLINTDHPLLCSKYLRKALGLSIDRSDLTEHLFFGEFPSISSLPKPLSMNEESAFIEEEDPNVLFEKALEELHLTRANFPLITFSFAELSGQRKLAEFIQQQWRKKLGIEIKIECAEWNVHMSKLRKGDYEIGTLHLTTLYQDPMFYFDLFRDKNTLCNYSRWEQNHFKELLQLSENTLDLKQRRGYLQQAEKLLFEEMPVIPLFTQNLQYLIRETVDLQINDLGIYDFKTSSVR